MAVTLHDPTLADLEYVALNMREADALEVYNAPGMPDDPFTLAEVIGHHLDIGHFGGVAKLDGVPAIVWGWTEISPSTLQAWAFGTENFRLASTALTKFVIRSQRPMLLGSVYQRMQADSRVGHTEAHRWLGVLGFKAEATLPEYGKDRSAYIRFVALREWFHVPTENAQAKRAASASQSD